MLLEQHLACASAESYLLLQPDQHYFGPKIFKAAQTLISEGYNPTCLQSDSISVSMDSAMMMSR